MRTMIYNLPRDLIEEIISRVPLKSMKAVRLTCKSWNNLFKSESFTNMHIGKATREGESMMIAMMPQNLYLMSGVVDNVDPSIELKGQLSFLSNEVNISYIDHYEGLILCQLKDVTRIVVWNPYLGQTRWIKLRYSHCLHGFNYALGYEDKESFRNLKILRYVDYFYKAAPEKQFFWYEIYDFESGLWTTLDVLPHWGIYCSSHSVSLKGNTYWCAVERSTKGRKDHIICFDFTRERFGPLLPLPSSVMDRSYVQVTLSCVKEEKLAALYRDNASSEYEFEIWITTKIEAEMVSWSKFLRIDTEANIVFSDTFFVDEDSFFIDEEKKVFMDVGRDYDSVKGNWDYDYPKTYIHIFGEAGYFRKLDPGLPADQTRWTRVCSYVPSLVQIKKLARVGKRKRQSSLEKRPFDQNRLRLAAIEGAI
ncbi:unnamed protein product [Arabidopsis halleri]